LRYSQADRGISRAQSWTSQRLGYAKELIAADYRSASAFSVGKWQAAFSLSLAMLN
jgi:hypothetical protein